MWFCNYTTSVYTAGHVRSPGSTCVTYVTLLLILTIETQNNSVSVNESQPVVGASLSE